MTKDMDYRNTKYCRKLINVSDKKKKLAEEIQKDSPRTKIIYNKVRDRNGKYHKRFYDIYNGKCAYCGILLGILPLEDFEVDHFINEASFSDTPEGRITAGRMENLVWSCMPCNRAKGEISIEPPYDQLLNTDNGNICKVFYRNDEFYIKIVPKYQNDSFIKIFYDKLYFGYERRRIDYLLLQIYEKMQIETNAKKKEGLEKSFVYLLTKRNKMMMTDRKQT